MNAHLLFSILEEEIDELVAQMERKYDKPNQTLWVVEYQPPLATRNNPGLVRNNTYVEAFIHAWIFKDGRVMKKVAPSAVKRHFQFPKTDLRIQYMTNKRFSIQKAQSILGGVVKVNDHIADCVLYVLYGFGYHPPH